MNALKIAGVSIWIWAAAVAIIVISAWTMLANSKTEPTEAGNKCLQSAKLMVMAERTVLLDEAITRIVRTPRLKDEHRETSKQNKRELDRRSRAYNKLLERLKDEESFFHRESEAIEKWVNEGRSKMKDLPRTERAMRGMDAERADTEWEIFMECDMVDLLNARG